MNNLFCIVGRLADIKDNKLFISVSNNYTKENEIVVVELLGNIYNLSTGYMKVKDLVGVKGYIKAGNTLVAEKITFLGIKE